MLRHVQLTEPLVPAAEDEEEEEYILEMHNSDPAVLAR